MLVEQVTSVDSLSVDFQDVMTFEPALKQSIMPYCHIPFFYNLLWAAVELQLGMSMSESVGQYNFFLMLKYLDENIL